MIEYVNYQIFPMYLMYFLLNEDWCLRQMFCQIMWENVFLSCVCSQKSKEIAAFPYEASGIGHKKFARRSMYVGQAC